MCNDHEFNGILGFSKYSATMDLDLSNADRRLGFLDLCTFTFVFRSDELSIADARF